MARLSNSYEPRQLGHNKINDVTRESQSNMRQTLNYVSQNELTNYLSRGALLVGNAQRPLYSGFHATALKKFEKLVAACTRTYHVVRIVRIEL